MAVVKRGKAGKVAGHAPRCFSLVGLPATRTSLEGLRQRARAEESEQAEDTQTIQDGTYLCKRIFLNV